MTIPTGEQQGVAGHISVGDYITVIASSSLQVVGASGAPGGAKVVSKTVFTNLRDHRPRPRFGRCPACGWQPARRPHSRRTSGVTSSLTVELTQCDAEYLTWFLNNTTVRYTLESFKDYSPNPPADNQDPACPAITAAGGVSQKQVDARYHFTAL